MIVERASSNQMPRDDEPTAKDFHEFYALSVFSGGVSAGTPPIRPILPLGKPLPAAHPAISDCCDCHADQAANSRFSRARSRVASAPYDANAVGSQLRWMPKQF